MNYGIDLTYRTFIIAMNNIIHPFARVGAGTPDVKYQGEYTTLTVGNNNVMREGVTLHRGTVQDRGDTTIGDDNLFLPYAHVGHDCVIGNNIVFGQDL